MGKVKLRRTDCPKPNWLMRAANWGRNLGIPYYTTPWILNGCNKTFLEGLATNTLWTILTLFLPWTVPGRQFNIYELLTPLPGSSLYSLSLNCFYFGFAWFIRYWGYQTANLGRDPRVFSYVSVAVLSTVYSSFKQLLFQAFWLGHYNWEELKGAHWQLLEVLAYQEPRVSANQPLGSSQNVKSVLESLPTQHQTDAGHDLDEELKFPLLYFQLWVLFPQWVTPSPCQPPCFLPFPSRANPTTIGHRHAAVEQTTRMHFRDEGGVLEPIY